MNSNSIIDLLKNFKVVNTANKTNAADSRKPLARHTRLSAAADLSR
jgi:hypothetical protein